MSVGAGLEIVGVGEKLKTEVGEVAIHVVELNEDTGGEVVAGGGSVVITYSWGDLK